MKKVLLTFVILYSFIGFAQQTIINDTLKPFGNGAYDFSCIIQDDSFYYAVGGINQNQPNWTNIICKFDNYCNLINKKHYLDTTWNYANYPYNSMIIDDNKIIICPQVFNDSNTFGLILAIDKYSLDTLWTNLIHHPDTIAASQPGAEVFSDLTAIKPTPDGGYILTGNYNKNCVTGDLRSFLLKTDSIGNVEWRKTYNDIAYVFNIEVVPWGGYTLLNSFGGRNFVLFDSLGNEIWRKKPNTNISLGATVDMSYDGNGAYIGSTTFKYTNSNGIDLYGINVFKIDFNSKQIIWDKTYKPFYKFYCLTMHQQLGVEALNNGDIIVSGTAYDGDHFGFILKLDSNGDSLWSKRYAFGPQGDDNCQINDLLVTDNNEFLGVGFYAPNSSNMAAWIFKTDSNGVLGIENKELGIKNEELRVFPNPANDFINIEIDKPNSYLSYYKIFDSQGKLVLSNDLVSNKINVKSLSSGIYFIECFGESGEVFRGKFVRN